MADESMTNWLSKNLGTAITLVILCGSVIASWAVAQYQIVELRMSQTAIREQQSHNQEAIIEMRADVKWIRETIDKGR